MNEALQIWKKIAGKDDGASEDQKASSQGEQFNISIVLKFFF